MKVIIWGHKLYSHTHFFIHYGFHKAFQALGYETYWFDDEDDVSNVDFNNSIFLTEGQVCHKMPRRKDCKYILHNVVDAEFRESGLHSINLQVYNKDCLTQEKINDYTFYDGRVLHQPWATDLLPDEIEISDATRPKNNTICFVGTSSPGWNDIFREWSDFKRAAQTKNIDFIKMGGAENKFIDVQEAIDLIKRAYCAPVLQSVKQRAIQYIPCRIFKNISYGQYPVTNCEHLQFLFPGKVIYNRDPYQLFFDFEPKKNSTLLKEMMTEVKEKHTYVNRIHQILDVL